MRYATKEAALKDAEWFEQEAEHREAHARSFRRQAEWLREHAKTLKSEEK